MDEEPDVNLRGTGVDTGGGRTSAAKQLAQLVLGIKVSQDGCISKFRRKWADRHGKAASGEYDFRWKVNGSYWH